MGWFKRHLGDWIAVHARAERTPPRVSLAVSLGELPEGWDVPRGRSRVWPGLVGVVCLAPFLGLLAASVLRALGVWAPYAWISNSRTAILAVTISLFIGIPVALAINLWRIARVGLQRRGGGLDGLVALEVAPLHLIVVLAAGLVGALFVGHLAADSYACMNGVRSAC
jgi:hypothetical protein